MVMVASSAELRFHSHFSAAGNIANIMTSNDLVNYGAGIIFPLITSQYIGLYQNVNIVNVQFKFSVRPITEIEHSFICFSFPN